MKLWLTNDTVAWEIPGGLISECYRLGLYMPPEPWRVREGRLPDEVRAFAKVKRKTRHVDALQLV
jgi:hypothetical protein